MKHRIPIDFHEIARLTGIRNMRLGYSDTWKSWMAWNNKVGGSPSAAYIHPPRVKGGMFKGNVILFVKIVDNAFWEIET